MFFWQEWCSLTTNLYKVIKYLKSHFFSRDWAGSASNYRYLEEALYKFSE